MATHHNSRWVFWQRHYTKEDIFKMILFKPLKILPIPQELHKQTQHFWPISQNPKSQITLRSPPWQYVALCVREALEMIC